MLIFNKTKAFVLRVIGLCLLAFCLAMCASHDSHKEMLALLAEVRRTSTVPDNPFSPDAKLVFMDSLLDLPNSAPGDILYAEYLKGNVLMELGREKEATALYEGVLRNVNASQIMLLMRELAMSHLRQGERDNCIAGHSAESCLLPVRGMGVHNNLVGSKSAVDAYTKILERNPKDLESRWLLNIAYMTLGDYPDKVPAAYLIPGMEGDTTVKVKPFSDIAGSIGIDTRNMAGGSIVDDFDNDGNLDIVTSSMDLKESMHYFRNNGDGTFTDLSQQSGLSSINGGLNMTQADYDNDGDRDILVLRGGWKRKYGDEPNSLIRNNGNGTFTDATTVSGLLSFHPTQTATWNDFNNDGWLDLFIGNESSGRKGEKIHKSELYLSNKDGTFTEVASESGIFVALYVKGVTSGDYDNDGLQDIFLSTISGQRVLLKNMGINGRYPVFKDVTADAHLNNEKNDTFTTWFFDYDNDGWLDIFACDYTFEKTLAFYAAAEKLDVNEGMPDKILLYHNNHDGTFTSSSKDLGVNKVTFSMGGNFGDIDNDGFLDIYLGTGNPQYQSLVPNKMYKNMGGKAFADVTSSARVGHLQKGHGVSFADLDNDGDQDIHIEMGGAYFGDAYPNSLFLNPGQSHNHWIKINLEGTNVNRDAIGTRIRIGINENGAHRDIYRDVNSGGSFGASPLRREIGVGEAATIEEIEITWPNKTVQKFQNVKADQLIKITEGKKEFETINVRMFNWLMNDPLCAPL